MNINDFFTLEKLRKGVFIFIPVFMVLNFLIIGFVVVFGFVKIKESQKEIYILGDRGDFFFATKESRSEHIEDLVLGLSYTFVDLFYNVDKVNYKTRMRRAVHLGEESVSGFYLLQEQQGWLSQIENFEVNQSIQILDIKITNTSSPYVVEVKFLGKVSSLTRKTSLYYESVLQLTVSNKGFSLSQENPYGLTIEKIEILSYKEL